MDSTDTGIEPVHHDAGNEPAPTSPLGRRLADLEGIRPPGLESDAELVATIATDIDRVRKADADSALLVKLVFSTRGRLIDGHQRRDSMLQLDPDAVVGPDDFVIDPLAIDDDTELMRAIHYQINRRNLSEAKRQRAAWAAMLRDERGLGQRRIAKLMGVSQAAVSQWFAEFPEYARSEATTIVGPDGKTYVSPATKVRGAKRAAPKPERWSPPFTPEEGDPECPECYSQGDEPCVNLDSQNELKRWHGARISEVTDYRKAREVLVPIPEDLDREELPECPECGGSASCAVLGYRYADYVHPRRMEAWAAVLASTARNEAFEIEEQARAEARRIGDEATATTTTAQWWRARISGDALDIRFEDPLTAVEVMLDGVDDTEARTLLAEVSELAVFWQQVQVELAAVLDLPENVPAPDLPPCPVCGAVGEAPCVSKSGAVTKRHARRVAQP